MICDVLRSRQRRGLFAGDVVREGRRQRLVSAEADGDLETFVRIDLAAARRVPYGAPLASGQIHVALALGGHLGSSISFARAKTAARRLCLIPPTSLVAPEAISRKKVRQRVNRRPSRARLAQRVPGARAGEVHPQRGGALCAIAAVWDGARSGRWQPIDALPRHRIGVAGWARPTHAGHGVCS